MPYYETLTYDKNARKETIIKSENINKQIQMKRTVIGWKSGIQRPVYSDQKYMVKTLHQYGNGDIEYILNDGTKMKFLDGSAHSKLFYTSGYIDFVHKRLRYDKERKAEEARTGLDTSTTNGIKSMTSKNSNKKEVDSLAANEAALSGETQNSSSAVDTSQFDGIKNKTVKRILMESGDYVKVLDSTGKWTFATDENGNYIQAKTDWEQYSHGRDNTLVSKYGENLAGKMDDLSGVHGMPFCFMPTTDSVQRGSIGRVYREHILDKTPLLLLTPGIPKFMDDFDDDTKNDILSAMGNGSNVLLDQLIGDESGMYYTFEFKFSEYYEYVNTILNAMATFLGLGNYGTTKWQSMNTGAFKGIVTSRQSVPFYIDAQTQATEQFSNVTGESALSENVNSVSAVAKELQFVLGGVGSAKFKELVESGVDSALSGLTSALSAFNNILPNRIINKLIGGFGTLVSGGKIVFPEIWQDSQFTKSQDVTVRFTSPSGDTESIFVNVLVPYIHLMCMVAPRQMGPNGYQAPYIVRAWYKSMFSTDMGIIDSMSVTRGDKGKWNKDGLPLSLEVTFTIKDLYSSLSITKRDGLFGTDLIQNPLLLSYISTLCGVNSYKPDILRTFDLYKNSIQNFAPDIINGIFDKALEGLTNLFNVENPNPLATALATGTLTALNAFKPKKDAQGNPIPVMPNGFMGVPRSPGESDEAYRAKAMRAYQEFDLKQKQAKSDAEIKKTNEEKSAAGKEFGLKPLKLKTVEEFRKSYPKSANMQAYTKYLEKEINKYEKDLQRAKDKKAKKK